MDLEVVTHFDVPPAAVFGAFCDAEFVRTRAEDLGHGSVTVLECAEVDTADDTVWRITVRRDVPLTVPAFARKVLTPTATVTQTDEWSLTAGEADEYLGTFRVTARGVPAVVTGTMRLAPEAGGCVQEIRGRVDVKVPVIGGKIKDLLVGDTLAVIEAEAGYGRRHFAGTP